MLLSYAELFWLSCPSRGLLEGAGEASFVHIVTNQDLHGTVFPGSLEQVWILHYLRNLSCHTSTLQTCFWVACVDQGTLLLLL